MPSGFVTWPLFVSAYLEKKHDALPADELGECDSDAAVKRCDVVPTFYKLAGDGKRTPAWTPRAA
jgi:hypothetical protein